jgi:hypothetical protein
MPSIEYFIDNGTTTILTPGGYSTASITCVGGGGSGASGSASLDYSVNPPANSYAAGSGGGAGQCVINTIKVSPGSYIQIIIGEGGVNGNGESTTAVYTDPAGVYPLNRFIINAPGGYMGDTGILTSPSSVRPINASSGSYGGGGNEIMSVDLDNLPPTTRYGIVAGIGSRAFGNKPILSTLFNIGKGGDGALSNVGNTNGIGGPDIFTSGVIQIYSLGGGGGGGAPGPIAPNNLLTPYGTGSYYTVTDPGMFTSVPAVAGILGSGGGGGAVVFSINGSIQTSGVTPGAAGGNGYVYIVFSA